jgi:hypothetical protein
MKRNYKSHLPIERTNCYVDYGKELINEIDSRGYSHPELGEARQNQLRTSPNSFPFGQFCKRQYWCDRCTYDCGRGKSQ